MSYVYITPDDVKPEFGAWSNGQEWCENNLNGQWIQTSYNTHGNKHPENRPLHKNYAGIGHIYDRTNDVFYAQQPFSSWILDKNTWTWQAPVARPDDGKIYKWDEEVKNWVEIIPEA